MKSRPDPEEFFQVKLYSDAAMTRLANSLAPHLEAGDVLLLAGPIGAGKSHFARAVIRCLLGDTAEHIDVPSPTFTLVQTYQAAEFEIWHSDLYRLSSVDEVYELGLVEAFTTSLCLVEWPEKLGAETPVTALQMEFQLCEDPDQRLLRFFGAPKHWQRLLPILTDFQANG